METVTELNKFLTGENKPTVIVDVGWTTIFSLMVGVLLIGVILAVITNAIAR